MNMTPSMTPNRIFNVAEQSKELVSRMIEFDPLEEAEGALKRAFTAGLEYAFILRERYALAEDGRFKDELGSIYHHLLRKGAKP